MADGDSTLADKWLARLKNHRLVAGVIILCAALAGLASLTNSVETISGPATKLVNTIWPPKIPPEVLSNLRKSVNEVRMMNSAKGAMMGALDNYIGAAGSPGSWGALLEAMQETKKQLLSARQEVIAYNSLRPQLTADPLLRVIDERNALLVTYLTNPPPAPISKKAAEELRDDHKKVIAKIDKEFELFVDELAKHQ